MNWDLERFPCVSQTPVSGRSSPTSANDLGAPPHEGGVRATRTKETEEGRAEGAEGAVDHKQTSGSRPMPAVGHRSWAFFDSKNQKEKTVSPRGVGPSRNENIFRVGTSACARIRIRGGGGGGGRWSPFPDPPPRVTVRGVRLFTGP